MSDILLKVFFFIILWNCCLKTKKLNAEIKSIIFLVISFCKKLMNSFIIHLRWFTLIICNKKFNKLITWIKPSLSTAYGPKLYKIFFQGCKRAGGDCELLLSWLLCTGCSWAQNTDIWWEQDPAWGQDTAGSPEQEQSCREEEDPACDQEQATAGSIYEQEAASSQGQDGATTFGIYIFLSFLPLLSLGIKVNSPPHLIRTIYFVS